MQVFKRSIITLIWGVLGGAALAVIIFIVGSIFTNNSMLLIGIGVVVMLLVWYLSIFSEAIRFELDSDGQFRYYKRGKLRNEFKLRECGIGYLRRSSGSTNHDIQLKILDSNGELTCLDASPLGASRFDKMFAAMEVFAPTGNESLKLENGKTPEQA